MTDGPRDAHSSADQQQLSSGTAVLPAAPPRSLTFPALRAVFSLPAAEALTNSAHIKSHHNGPVSNVVEELFHSFVLPVFCAVCVPTMQRASFTVHHCKIQEVLHWDLDLPLFIHMQLQSDSSNQSGGFFLLILNISNVFIIYFDLLCMFLFPHSHFYFQATCRTPDLNTI